MVRSLPDEADDSALVDGLRSGEMWAREALFDRYAPLVARILGRVMGRDAELSDLLHDTFVQAYASIHRLQDPGALKGWLSSVAIFTARAVIRKRKVRRWLSFSAPEDLPEAPSSSSDPSSRYALLRVYAILDTLPTDDRIAFALRFVEGMELSEIGEQCRCSLATVKRRIARAEEKFLEAARGDPALCQRIEGGRWASQ